MSSGVLKVLYKIKIFFTSNTETIYLNFNIATYNGFYILQTCNIFLLTFIKFVIYYFRREKDTLKNLLIF